MPTKRTTAGETSTAPKRTRFASPPPRARARSPTGSVEPDDNDLLEEDLPENAQREKQLSRRRVKLDGYGSDSSGDDEGVVPSRRPGVDADVDMFGEVEPEQTTQAPKKAFMELKDIEGQELEGAAGITDGADLEGAYDEEEEAERRRREKLDGDMGFEVTPFNMKNEMDEGRFTADGEEYIANDADPNDRHDVWLAEVDDEAMEKAAKAHAEREEVEREREEREATTGREREVGLLREVVVLMERGETVLEAMQRLGAEVEKKSHSGTDKDKKKSWVERQKERKAMMAVGEAEV